MKPTITILNTDSLIERLKGDNPEFSMYDEVYFKHPVKTKNEKILTTYGRIIFNSLLPEDYPYINKPVNNSELSKILKDIIEKYDINTYNDIVYKIQKYSLILSTIVPATIEISELDLPEEIKKAKQELMEKADQLNPIEFDEELDKLYDMLEKYLEKKGVTFFDMIKSGTKGKKSDLQQLFLAWGAAIDPISKDIPIVKHSLLDGLTPEEMYYGANKARYSAYIKSVGVAPIGYFERKARFILDDVVLSEDDCKTTKFFELKVTPEISKIILGRYYYDEKDKKLKVIDEENVKNLIGKTIKLRSPLYCKSKNGICKTCYGKLAEQLNSKNIGLAASQAFYVLTLNKGMKMSHHKLTAGDKIDFRKELKKYFS